MGARPENSVQDLFLALRTLCRRVDFLTSRVSHLETLLEERPEIGWTVVSEESLPLESGYYGSRFSSLLVLGLWFVLSVLGPVDFGVVWL